MSLHYIYLLANMCNYVPMNSLQISQFFLEIYKYIKKILIDTHTKIWKEIIDAFILLPLTIIFQRRTRKASGRAVHNNWHDLRRDQRSRLHENFWLHVRLKNDCIWIKNQHIWRNEIFPIVLSQFGFHSALGISTLDFIQPEFTVNWT